MIKKSTTLGKFLATLAGVSLIATTAACAGPNNDSATVDEVPSANAPEGQVTEDPMAAGSTEETLDQVVSENDSFSTLNAAIQAAGLEATLSGTGPFTVFAPTNEAFEALPAGTVDQLLLPENKEALQQLLSYHVVPGNVTSADIAPGDVETVEGSPVTIAVDGSNVMVGDATVVEADILASNGVVHAIDKVLLPPDAAVQ